MVRDYKLLKQTHITQKGDTALIIYQKGKFQYKHTQESDSKNVFNA